MKYLLRALPTLFLIAFCLIASREPTRPILSEPVRQAEVRDLHRQLAGLRIRLDLLEIQPGRGTIPRGMGPIHHS